MSDFTFEENSSFKSPSIIGEPTSPKMVKALLKTGIIKNEKHAGFVLIGFTILCFALALYISYAFIFAGNTTRKLTPEQEKQKQEFQERIRQGRSSVPAVQNAPVNNQ